MHMLVGIVDVRVVLSLFHGTLSNVLDITKLKFMLRVFSFKDKTMLKNKYMRRNYKIDYWSFSKLRGGSV